MNTAANKLNVETLRQGLQAKATEQADKFGEAIILLQRGKVVLENVDAAVRTLEANIHNFVQANGGVEKVQEALARGEFANLALAKMRLDCMMEGLDSAKEDVKKAEDAVANFTVI